MERGRWNEDGKLSVKGKVLSCACGAGIGSGDGGSSSRALERSNIRALEQSSFRAVEGLIEHLKRGDFVQNFFLCGLNVKKYFYFCRLKLSFHKKVYLVCRF